MTGEPERDEQLPPAEAARARRRDRDASAAARKGMRTGLAKQFKQVLEAQVKRAALGPVRDDLPGAILEPPPPAHGTRLAIEADGATLRTPSAEADAPGGPGD